MPLINSNCEIEMINIVYRSEPSNSKYFLTLTNGIDYTYEQYPPDSSEKLIVFWNVVK